MQHGIGTTLWRAFYNAAKGLFGLQQVTVADPMAGMPKSTAIVWRVQCPDGTVVLEQSRYLYAKKARADAVVESYNARLSTLKPIPTKEWEVEM